MNNKIQKIFFRTLLVPMLLLVTLPLSLISSQIANAYGTVGVTSSPDNQALSYWYYAAMKTCFDTASGVGVGLEYDNTKTKAGQIFSDALISGDSFVYGFYAKTNLTDVGDDGITGCGVNTNALPIAALKFWQINAVDMLCEMGYTRENNTSCTDTTAGNNFKIDTSRYANGSNKSNSYSKAFTVYMREHIYNGADPTTLSSAGKYSFFSKTLINACTTTTGSSSKPNAPSGSYYALSTGTDANGSTTTTYFNQVQDRNYDWQAYTYAGSSDKTTCKKLMDNANSNFPAWISQQTCTTSAALKNFTSQIQACINGASNQSNIKYCSTTYADGVMGPEDHTSAQDNSALRIACYAGQGNAGADGCIASGVATITSGLLQACINGSQNPTNPGYCDSKYPSPDSIQLGKPIADPNAANRAACVQGQKLPNTLTLSSVGLTTGNTGSGANTGTSTCGVQGIGWIICPTFTFLAGIADGLYGFIQGFLVTDISAVSTASATYQAWQIMRNFANVGFVIVFLIIIFSQISNLGVSNYGIKKMFPRLIIAAVLVNVSFFIGQIAVDLSNILGGSIKPLFDGLPIFGSGGDFFASGNFFTQAASNVLSVSTIVTGAGIAVTAVAFGGVGLLIPVILSAVLAFIVTLGVLVLRQVLVILLLVISPLAFLAMLLPNTENYFKQWRKMFVGILVIYPLIALLFGASHLAAAILVQSTTIGTSAVPFSGSLISSVALILPLFLVPKLVQGSLSAIPMVGAFASRMSSRANGNIAKSGKKRYEQSRLGQFGKFWKGERDLRRAQVQSGTYKGDNRLYKAASSRNSLINSATGKFGTRSAAQGATLANKMQDEEVSNSEILLRANTNASDRIVKVKIALEKAIKDDDVVTARASQKILLASGATGLDALNDALLKEADQPGRKMTTSVSGLRSDIDAANLKGVHNGMATWAHNDRNTSLQQTNSDAGTMQALNSSQLAGQTQQLLKTAAASGKISNQAARDVINNENVYKDLDENKKALFNQIAGMAPDQSATPPPSNAPPTPPPSGSSTPPNNYFG
jgi:hypothetical protein